MAINFGPDRTLQDLAEACEPGIKDMAGVVKSYVALRRDRPSYGYTKAMIRETYNKLEGQLGLYMYLTGQASHTNAPGTLCKFRDAEVEVAVRMAREMVKTI